MPAPVAQKPGFGYFGVGKQTLVGTGVAPVYFAPWKSLSFKPVIDNSLIADGTQRDSSVEFKFDTYFTGDVTTYLYPSLGTVLLGAALSGADAVTGAADPYAHAISTDYHNLYPLSIETGYGSVGTGDYLDVWRAVDCYASNVQLTIPGGKEPEIKFSYTAATATPQATPTAVSFESDRPMVPSDAVYTWNGLTVNGFPVNTVIDIKNSIDVVKRGDSQAVYILPGRREITVTADLAVTDKILIRRLITAADAGTTVASALNAVTSLTVKCDLAGSPDHFVQIVLNNLRMQAGDPTFDMNGKIFLVKGLKFTAKFVTGTPALQLTSQTGIQTAYF